MSDLQSWLDEQYRRSAEELLASISAVTLTKQRPGFGQQLQPRRGSVIASPALAAYDPDPDYCFHWFRDSAVVMDAVLCLLRAAQRDGTSRHALPPALLRQHFVDFVDFSRALADLDGRALVTDAAWRERVQPDFRQYLRDDVELGAVHGAAIAGETRVNPDGTLDISRWARPQNDGPALRALVLLRWLQSAQAVPEATRSATQELLHADLRFVLERARQPCFDIWEEEQGLHYYTLCASAAALEAGADWLQAQSPRGAGDGSAQEATACRAEAAAIRGELDALWAQSSGFYRSRRLSSGATSAKELDIAVIFAAVHAPLRGTTHNACDARMQATLQQLEALFERRYPINQGRPRGRGVAFGRYEGDRYYAGGAYYFSTLAAAELCYRAALEDRALLARGDAILETVRAYTPANGELSEQFDQRTGEQCSAKRLAWSYAALITCAEARGAALRKGAP